jgi:hypothetical protein
MAEIMDPNADDNIWSLGNAGGRVRMRLLEPTAAAADRSAPPVLPRGPRNQPESARADGRWQSRAHANRAAARSRRMPSPAVR